MTFIIQTHDDEDDLDHQIMGKHDEETHDGEYNHDDHVMGKTVVVMESFRQAAFLFNFDFLFKLITHNNDEEKDEGDPNSPHRRSLIYRSLYSRIFF